MASGNPFLPRFEGVLELPALPADFPERVARRVERGFLVPGSRARANYRVIEIGPDTLALQSADFGTSINIGLNTVVLRRVAPNGVSYRVTFWPWTAFVASLGAAIGLILLVTYFFVPGVRDAIAARPPAGAYFWANAAFWCLLWPWILTALHRRFAARALERVLREELSR